MFHKFLFCLALLPIATIHAMEQMPQDILIYNIGAHLHRFIKNNFKNTNKRHHQTIMSQETLNENYAKASAQNNVELMIEWRKRGALHYHKEIYTLYLQDETNLKDLTKSLYLNQIRLKPLCINNIFTYGITRNNKDFIEWLLNTQNPAYNSDLIKNALTLANDLKYQNIIDQLNWYITKSKPGHNDRLREQCYNNEPYYRLFP